MGISTNDPRREYDGDGVTVNFPTPIFLDNADIKLYIDNVLMTLTTDYSLTGAGDEDGGTLTAVVAPGVGDGNVIIICDPAILQQEDLPSTGPFPSTTVERMSDRLTLIAQRLRDLLGRSLTLSDSDSSSASTMLPSPSSRKLIGWNSSANALQNYAAADIPLTAVSSFIQTLLDDPDGPTALGTLGAVAKSGDAMTGLLKLKAGANIGSTATVNLSNATGNSVHITGTTNISAWTMSIGQVMDVIFDGVLTLTHNAANNNLPGTANINTAAGDRARLYYDGTTVWVLQYQRASGYPVMGAPSYVPPVTVSGTATNISLAIPSWARVLFITFNAVSTNGTNNYLLQGGSGSFDTTGYVSDCGTVTASSGTNFSTSGFLLTNAVSATDQLSGVLTLVKQDDATNLWVVSGTLNRSGGGGVILTGGKKAFSGALDRLRFTTVGATDNGDNGSIGLTILG